MAFIGWKCPSCGYVMRADIVGSRCVQCREKTGLPVAAPIHLKAPDYTHHPGSVHLILDGKAKCGAKIWSEWVETTDPVTCKNCTTKKRLWGTERRSNDVKSSMAKG